jgi:DNA-binding MarR family transcriptional regulator
VIECSINITVAADCQTLNHLGYARQVNTPETRWLTTGEQQAWRGFLTACNTLFGAIDAQLQHNSGLPHGYYEILVRLSEAPGRALRMSQLAEASTSSKSRLSHAVARLEDRGWVRRVSCPTDRRGQIAELTDAGFAVLAAAAPGHVKQVRRSLLDPLTAEQVEQLRQISTAITAAGDGQGVPRAGACPLGGIAADPDEPEDSEECAP